MLIANFGLYVHFETPTTKSDILTFRTSLNINQKERVMKFLRQQCHLRLISLPGEKIHGRGNQHKDRIEERPQDWAVLLLGTNPLE